MHNEAYISIIFALIDLYLFIYWTRKNAIMSFRAWALLMLIIRVAFIFQFKEITLNRGLIDFLWILQGLVTVVTIWRLWKASESYLPTNKVKQLNTRNKLLTRLYSLVIGFRHGGNHTTDGKRMVESQIKRLKK